MTEELYAVQEQLDFLYDQLDRAMMLDDPEAVYRIEKRIDEVKQKLKHTYIPLI